MSVITLPDNNFRSINWTLAQPTQLNRSEFTSARQVMQLPGASYWKASVDHAPIIGEANVRPWRGFFALTGGQANTFRIEATEGDQHSGARPFIVNSLFITPTNVTGTTTGVGLVLRSAATDGNWAAARSAATVGDGAELSFSVSAITAGGATLVGLNTSASTIAGGADPQFGLWFDGTTGMVSRYVAGVMTDIQVHDPASRYAIEVEGTAVNFYIDGELKLSSTGPGATSYYAEAAIIAAGDRVSDMAFAVPNEVGNDVRLCGLPISAELVPAGSFATVPLKNGGEQLVVIRDGAAGDTVGLTLIFVTPIVRGLPMPSARLETKRPWCLMAMDSPEATYSVDPGAVYGFGFSATEAF